MTATRTPAQGSLVFPAIFLIGTIVVLAVLFSPQPVRSTLILPTAVPTEVVAVAQPAAARVDTSNMDHLTLMAMGLEEVNASSVRRGERIFSVTCTPCHGFDAKGISGLGKTLVGSEFVNALNDNDLVAFLITGRPATDPLNTTGQIMPPRGNNPSLTDEDLHAIVDYVRSLNGATVIDDIGQQTASGSGEFVPLDFNSINASAVQPSGGASGSADLSALTPVEFTPADINALDPTVVKPSDGVEGGLVFADMNAQQSYRWSCAGCHGLDGRGNPILNSGDLSRMSADDATIVTLLTQPSVEAGAVFTHPIRGGYPVLTDEQLAALLAYVRELVKN